MKRFYHIGMSWLTSWQILYLLTAAMSVGIFYARSLVSITTGSFLAIGVLALLDRTHRSGLWQRREIRYLMGIFLIYVVSVMVSTDHSKWLSQLNIGLPYLGIPLGLAAFYPVTRKMLTHLICIYIGATLISAGVIVVDYAGHWQEYNRMYKFGQTIPTPILHVWYSYFVALACCLGAGLLLDGAVPQRILRRGLLAATVGLFVVLHLLAVRTGLFACYGGLMTVVVVHAMRNRRWRQVFAMVALILVVFTAGYWLLPSMRNKIDYMRYDLRMLVEHGALPEYSDNTRVVSYQHGLRVFAEHPVFGAGIGDVTSEIASIYLQDTPQFPADRRYLPESDYIYWLATFGLVGTVILLALVLYPLGLFWRQSYLMVALYAVTLISSLGVTTLQLQLGKTAFLVLLCIVLQYCRSQVVAEPVITPG
ncbi:MAG: O-antigen ligase family protein [Saprospiraceae bacterium]|nr:O-antigen ligase family protein [Saprospiraceae bacterium]